MRRQYLYVPVQEREQVRALGARWDADAKCWYIGRGADTARFARWLGDGISEEFSIISSRASQSYASTVRTGRSTASLTRISPSRTSRRPIAPCVNS